MAKYSKSSKLESYSKYSIYSSLGNTQVSRSASSKPKFVTVAFIPTPAGYILKVYSQVKGGFDPVVEVQGFPAASNNQWQDAWNTEGSPIAGIGAWLFWTEAIADGVNHWIWIGFRGNLNREWDKLNLTFASGDFRSIYIETARQGLALADAGYYLNGPGYAVSMSLSNWYENTSGALSSPATLRSWIMNECEYSDKLLLMPNVVSLDGYSQYEFISTFRVAGASLPPNQTLHPMPINIYTQWLPSVDPLHSLYPFNNTFYNIGMEGQKLYSFSSDNLNQGYLNAQAAGNAAIYPEIAPSDMWGTFSSSSTGELIQIEAFNPGSQGNWVSISYHAYQEALPGISPPDDIDTKDYYVCNDQNAENYYITTFLHYTASGDNQQPPLSQSVIDNVNSNFIHSADFCEYCDDLSGPLTADIVTSDLSSCISSDGEIAINVTGGNDTSSEYRYKYSIIKVVGENHTIVSEFTPQYPTDQTADSWSYTATNLESGTYKIVVQTTNKCGDKVQIEVPGIKLDCEIIELEPYCSQSSALNYFLPSTLSQAGATVGSEYEGGIVFKISDDGTKALIISKEDVAFEDASGNITNQGRWVSPCALSRNLNCVVNSPGTLGDALFTGEDNTALINQQCDGLYCSPHSAAWRASGYSVEGSDGVVYSDWFLPSIEELRTAINVLHTTAYNSTMSFTQGNSYWTSSEHNSTIAHSMIIGPLDFSHVEGTTIKTNDFLRIRAVRVATLTNTYTIQDSLCMFCHAASGQYSLTDTGVVSSGEEFLNISRVTTSNSVANADGSDSNSGEAIIQWNPNNYTNQSGTFNFQDFDGFSDNSGYWVIKYKVLTHDMASVLQAQYGSDYLLWKNNGTLNSPTVINTNTSSTTYQFEELEAGGYFFEISWNYPASTVEIEDCFSLGYFAIDLLGCTDSNADNYNSNATIDNGTCTYTLTGDVSEYLVFQIRNANVNSVDACEFRQIVEFMIVGIDAPDYDQWIPLSDDIYQPGNIADAVTFILATQSGVNLSDVGQQIELYGFSINWVYNTSNVDGTGIQTIAETSNNAGSGGPLNNGGHQQLITFPSDLPGPTGLVGINSWEMQMAVMFSETDSEYVSFTINPPLIYYLGAEENLCEDCNNMTLITGCMNPLSCNYNPEATIACDGCCQEVNQVCGCTDSGFLEYWFSQYYDYGGYLDAGLFQDDFPNNPNLPHPSIGSPLDESQCNTIAVPGCMDPNYVEYNPNANINNGECYTYIINGCTDPGACNYNPGATVDDGSCHNNLTIDCEDFGSWKIANNSIPPSNCGETTPNNDGILILTNTDYNGPFQMNIIGPGFSSSDQDVIWADGLAATVMAGQEVNSEATQDGLDGSNPYIEYTITQTQSGSTVTISGMSTGVYSINILGNGDPSTPIAQEESCVCAVASWQVADDSGLGWLIDNPGTGDDVGSRTVRLSIGASSNECGCTDINSTGYVVSATEDDGTCIVYGCMDQTASNYNAAATVPCSDPENQLGAPYGIAIPTSQWTSCQPCVYGYADNMYTPQFCMPDKLGLQQKVLKNCVASAGTKSYINTITGQKDPDFKKAWILLMIDYLLSKEGLDCLYNCASDGTNDLDNLITCTDRRIFHGLHIGNISAGGKFPNPETSAGIVEEYAIGDTILYGRTKDSAQYFKLKRLPLDHPHIGLSVFDNVNVPFVSGAGKLIVRQQADYVTLYPAVNGANVLAVMSPTHPYGSTLWKRCEAPPTKPHNEDYLGKFLKFVEVYCRTCMTETPKPITASDVATGGLLTAGGIIISVNNNNFE